MHHFISSLLYYSSLSSPEISIPISRKWATQQKKTSRFFIWLAFTLSINHNDAGIVSNHWTGVFRFFKVRHAQGVHNVAGAQDHSALMSPQYFDAHLSPLGSHQVSFFLWLPTRLFSFFLSFLKFRNNLQVQDLRSHVVSSGLLQRIQLVISSPLSRWVFQNHPSFIRVSV
mgnify:CR=1 FL=1